MAPKKFKQDNLATHALFQYMIGNTDWELRMVRNLKLLNPQDGSPMILVPYDFDFSGLVDAKYAVPNDNLGLKSVRERKFISSGENDETMASTLELFKNRKDEVYELLKNFQLLNKIYGVSNVVVTIVTLQ